VLKNQATCTDCEVEGIQVILTLHVVQHLPHDFVRYLTSTTWAVVGHAPIFERVHDGIELVFRCGKLYQHLICSGAFHSVCLVGTGLSFIQDKMYTVC